MALHPHNPPHLLQRNALRNAVAECHVLMLREGVVKPAGCSNRTMFKLAYQIRVMHGQQKWKVPGILCAIPLRTALLHRPIKRLDWNKSLTGSFKHDDITKFL